MPKIIKISKKNKFSAKKIDKRGRTILQVPSFSIRTRPTNAKPTQKVNIYLLINYLGQKTELKTNFCCQRNEFSNNPPTITRKAQNKLFQEYLESLFVHVLELKALKPNYTIYELKEAIQDGGVSVFIPTIEHLVEEFEELKKSEAKNGDLSLATFRKIQGWNRKLSAYLAEKYGHEGIIEQIIPADGKQFHVWLKSHYKLSHNVANKIVQHFKTVLNYALELDFIDKNPLFNINLRYEAKRTEYLSQEEIRVIELTKIEHPELAVHKDIFLFMSYTGLAYADVKSLRKENIVITSKSEVYINKVREKTNQRQTIPLIPKALNLLLKYENHPICIEKDVCFPILSNQKTNSYLRQLGVICNISKPITSHLARKTCATWLKANNVPTQIITEWLGHSSITMTEKYYFGHEPERMVSQALKILNKSNLQ